MTVNSASARYEGFGKDGKGHLWTKRGALDGEPYGFASRFEDGPGTNPEELIAAAHAACFTMALSFALARAGHSHGQLDTRADVTLERDGDGFQVTKSALTLTATIPGIAAEEFASLAADAEATCPISKLLNCKITLTHSLSD
ncbi:OsmC family protein [Sphingopyxis flava]|uniref:Osmotically inducible protein OsmC n=1 Tax=Sphingopyxis flava TaxID=1507287 RepID=A0A1T5EZ53_9SPHN|nr:OsmC family protein [Sphingopyxis flava]SKB89232.1 osmotically inducible protein OsmC [Sphingopyxis flava]